MFLYLVIGVVVFIAQILYLVFKFDPSEFSSAPKAEDIPGMIGTIIGFIVYTLIWPITLAKNIYDVLMGVEDQELSTAPFLFLGYFSVAPETGPIMEEKPKGGV